MARKLGFVDLPANCAVEIILKLSMDDIRALRIVSKGVMMKIGQLAESLKPVHVNGNLPSRFPHLLALDLTRCTSDVVDNETMQALGRLTTLTALALRGGRSINYEGFQHLTNLRRLKSLKLRDCYHLNSDCIEGVAQNLGAGLTELDLTGALELEDETFSIIVPHLHRLRQLSLHLCHSLTPASLRRLPQFLELHTLNLQNLACLTDASLARCGPLPALTRLELGHNVNLRTLCYDVPCVMRPSFGLHGSSARDPAMFPVLPVRHLPRLRTKPRHSGVIVRAHGSPETLELVSDDAGMFFISESPSPLSVRSTDPSPRSGSPTESMFAAELPSSAVPVRVIKRSSHSAAAWKGDELSDAAARECEVVRLDEAQERGMSDLAMRWPALEVLSLRGNTALEDAALLHVAALSKLSSLDLDHCDNISDTGVQHVLGMRALKSLTLHSCSKVTCQAFGNNLEELAPLTQLVLADCNCIRNPGLRHISKLVSLENLSVHGCNGIGDSGLECVTCLSKLTLLDISKCPGVTSTSSQYISSLRSLRSLDLSATSIKGGSLASIAALTLLTSLSIAGLRDVGDDVTQHLRELQHLQTLNIGRTSVSEESILHLQAMPCMETINYYACHRIPANGQQSVLRKTTRNCAVGAYEFVRPCVVRASAQAGC